MVEPLFILNLNLNLIKYVAGANSGYCRNGSKRLQRACWVSVCVQVHRPHTLLISLAYRQLIKLTVRERSPVNREFSDANAACSCDKWTWDF